MRCFKAFILLCCMHIIPAAADNKATTTSQNSIAIVREISNTLPAVATTIAAVNSEALEALTKIDMLLGAHLPTVERIIDNLALFAPSDQAITKWSTRGLTVATAFMSTRLAYKSCLDFGKFNAKNEGDPEKKRFLWSGITRAFFAMCGMSVAAYLYIHYWDIHSCIPTSLLDSRTSLL